jgi:hypothetical protein
MKALAKLIGFGALCLVGAVSSDVGADQRLTCAMKGMWVERNDNFYFDVSYVSKDGPDSFSGIYINKSAGATANVSGYALKGTWDIKFTYTDAVRQGVILELTGTGSRDKKSNKLTISGTYKATQHAEKLNKASRGGKFSMTGKCR